MKHKSSDEIKTLITQLRERVKDILAGNEKFDNDYYLYRWLIHHQLKLDGTEKAIRKSIEWRQLVNLDELADREWAFFAPGLEKKILVHFEGFSKTGQPVSSTNGEDIDARSLIQKYGKESLIRYFYQFFAKLEKSLLEHYQKGQMQQQPFLSKSGKNSSLKTIEEDDQKAMNAKLRPEYIPEWDSAAAIHIVSYKNFSLWNATCVEGIQCYMEGAKAGMTYFPAVATKVYVVNLNKFSSMLLKTIKPVFDMGSFTLEFFDTDKTKWSKALMEGISEDQLQLYFGGTQVVLQDSNKLKYNFKF